MFADLKKKLKNEEVLTAYLCLIPAALIFGTFILFPVGYAAWLSLMKGGLITKKVFVGFQNYHTILSSSIFWNSLWCTIYYTLGTVPPGIVLSLFLALLLNNKLFGVSVYRSMYFTPVVTSTVAVAVIWVWMYEPNFGVLNYLLSLIGLRPLGWLSDPRWSMPAIILMSVWKNLGFTTVIFLAGLQGIPHIFYEAARMDGAGRWSLFWHITIPLLRSTFFFTFVISLIFSFQAFDQVFVMTKGGPIGSTDVLIYYLFRYGFRFFKMGQACAIAFILFFIMFTLTAAQWKFFSRRALY